MNREACLFIIESLSHDDFYLEQGEAEALEELLKPLFPCYVRCATTEDLLLRALQEASRSQPLGPLYLHISCHGSQDGLYLTDGTMIRWNRLADILRPLNSDDRPIVLFLSCCHGLFGSRMAFNSHPLPFQHLVSFAEKPTWDKTRLAAHAFYCNIAWGRDVQKAVQAACAATHDNSLAVVSGRAIRSQCNDYLPVAFPPNPTADRLGPGRAFVPDGRGAVMKSAVLVTRATTARLHESVLKTA